MPGVVMEEMQQGGSVQADGEWLSPVEALNRFELSAGTLTAATAPEARARYGYSVSTLNFLIKAGSNSEVVRKPAIWPIPGAPVWVLGLLNLRSNLVPVFDLARMLGMDEDNRHEQGMVLVFEQGDRAVGVLIDDYPKPLQQLTQLLSLPQLPTAIQGHIRAGYLKGETVWLEFDHESYFEDAVCNSAQ